jgi:splicing factor 45
MTRPVVSSSSSDAAPAVTSQQPGIDYWRSTAEDDAAALDYKRQMDKQMREKKKQEKKFNKQFGWWKGDAQYKADRPSNIKAYRASGGYRLKLTDFKKFLQTQPISIRPSRSRQNSGEVSRPTSKSSVEVVSSRRFAPPVTYDLTKSPPVDAAPPPPPPPPDVRDAPPPPPPVPASYNPTISAEPVRYVRPVVRDQKPDRNRERPAKRQKISKAEAMMAKMGYKKGEGLGKNSDGITTHLEVQARKAEYGHGRKIQVDNFDEYHDDKSNEIKSQQVFDILGGHITKRKEPDRFGEQSKVVVTWGCVDGVDWVADGTRNDGGIRQEMGQTFDQKVCSVICTNL